MFQFKLPDLGEGVHEGEILHWYVKTGDQIKADDPLVEVETDKAAVTIPSPRGGTVMSTTGAVGETVPVGTIIVEIQEGASASAGGNGQPAAAAPVAPAPAAPVAAAKPAPTQVPPVQQTAIASTPRPAPAPVVAVAQHGDGPVPAAPATRRLARELGIDLRTVPGSGPGGRVTNEDVKAFSATGASAVVTTTPSNATPQTSGSAPAAGYTGGIPFLEVEPMPDFSQWGAVEKEALRSIRRKIAHKMVSSMILVPHVAHMDEADVTELDVFRRRERERRKGETGAKLTLLPFVVRAVIALLKQYREFNASVDPFAQEIVYKNYYNIGFAADTDKGLVVPVIHNADRLSIVELANKIEDLALRARDGKLDVSELRGGTFTITNLGNLGGTGVIPTINYPEVAILGMGRAVDKPVVRDGQIVIRKILPMTIAFDHRIIDGANAARLMTSMVRRLSDPSVLLLET